MTLGMTHEAEYLREISFISTFKFCNRAAHALAMEAQLIEGASGVVRGFPSLSFTHCKQLHFYMNNETAVFY